MDCFASLAMTAEAISVIVEDGLMLDHVSIMMSDIPAAASYYAAFLRDPDGNRIEALCHLAV